MGDEILKLEDVVKSYHNHLAVDRVSFTMRKGCIFGMLGPNGAGKTSLIRIITTITQADSGSVFLEGEKLNASHPEQIGYMPEERGLYKKMGVGENLMYLAQLKGMSHKKAKSDIGEWMERFEITEWWDKKVEELSKGMQQKIQFISTVVHRPKLLILDEPFSGLDPINTNLIKDEIARLNSEGTSIIFSTHRMEQVEEICEEIVLINAGKNILNGTVSEIKNKFKDNLFEVKSVGANQSSLIDFPIHEQINEKTVIYQLNEGQEPNDLLRKLIDLRISIQSFQEVLPSLNEIFIKKVGGDA